jgi:hypothetical protein
VRTVDFGTMVRTIMIVVVAVYVAGMIVTRDPELALRRLPEGMLDRLRPPDPGDARSVAFLIKPLRQFLAQLDIDSHRVRLLALGQHRGNRCPTTPLRPKRFPHAISRHVVPVPQTRSSKDGFVVQDTRLM